MSHARPGLTTCSQYDAALHALSAARQRWAENLSEPSSGAPAPDQGCPGRHCPGVGGRGSGGQRVAGGRSAGGGRSGWRAPARKWSAATGLSPPWSNWRRRPFCGGSHCGRWRTAAPALRVVPGTLWDRLLLSGVRAEIWMQPGASPGPISTAMRRGHTTSRLPRGRASWRWCLAPAMWPRLRHWMCYTSCLLRIRSAC